MPLGPLVGGWLLDGYWWGSIFLINVPLIVVGIVACLLLLPETRDPAAPAVDVLSTALSFGGLAALVYGLIEGASRGWDDPLVIGTLGASVPLLVLLVARERRRAHHPILDIALLRDPGFGWNALVGALVSFVLAGLLFVIPQYLQVVRGHDTLETGVRVVPVMAGLLVGARVCQPLVRVFGRRGVMVSGLVMLSFAGFLGSSTGANSDYALLAAWLAVAGLGAGLTLVPAIDAALVALPPERSGTGTALLMTMRHVGSAIGVALLGSLLAQAYRGGLETGGLSKAVADAARESVVAAHEVAERAGPAELIASADSAFVRGMSLMLFVCGIAGLAAALLAGALLPGAEAEAEAEEQGEGGGRDVAVVEGDRGE
jgi:MFS family permease